MCRRLQREREGQERRADAEIERVLAALAVEDLPHAELVAIARGIRDCFAAKGLEVSDRPFKPGSELLMTPSAASGSSPTASPISAASSPTLTISRSQSAIKSSSASPQASTQSPAPSHHARSKPSSTPLSIAKASPSTTMMTQTMSEQARSRQHKRLKADRKALNSAFQIPDAATWAAGSGGWG